MASKAEDRDIDAVLYLLLFASDDDEPLVAESPATTTEPPAPATTTEPSPPDNALALGAELLYLGAPDESAFTNLLTLGA